jgi:hypothetical protein
MGDFVRPRIAARPSKTRWGRPLEHVRTVGAAQTYVALQNRGEVGPAAAARGRGGGRWPSDCAVLRTTRRLTARSDRVGPQRPSIRALYVFVHAAKGVRVAERVSKLGGGRVLTALTRTQRAAVARPGARRRFSNCASQQNIFFICYGIVWECLGDENGAERAVRRGLAH